MVNPRKLPIVNLDGESYFFDVRLSQFRKVCEPHEFIDLSPDEKKNLLEALLYLEHIGSEEIPRRADEQENA
jgi:hypothetical protein